jgi:DNA-binding transcriptional LysR family regulator
VRPTAAGSALHSHALQVLRLADATREVARSAVPVLERVEIGLPPAPQPWLHHALRAIGEEVPHAAVSFTDASSAEQLRMVGEGASTSASSTAWPDASSAVFRAALRCRHPARAPARSPHVRSPILMTCAFLSIPSEPSATRTLPDWPWRTLINPTVHLCTRATPQDRTRTVVIQAMETLCRIATTPGRS